MAVCDACGLETTDPATRSCVLAPVEYPDGTKLAQIAHESEAERDAARARLRLCGTGEAEIDEIMRHDPGRCRDCGVAKGGMHHPGCFAECCPRCGGQLVGCGCLSEDEEDDE